MVDERQVALTKALMTHFEAIGVSRRQFFKLLAKYGGGAGVAALIAACGGAEEGTETPAAPAA